MAFIQRWGFFILVALLLYLARGIITPFVVAVILAYIFSPLVDTVEERLHAPRILVIFGLYVLIIAGIVLAIYTISGQLNKELDGLRKQGPDIIGNVVQQFTGGNDITLFGATVTGRQIAEGLNSTVQDFLQQPTGALDVAKSVAEGLLNTVLMLLVMFYLLFDWHRIGGFMIRFVPADRRARITEIWGNIQRVLGFYLRGQILLIILMSLVMFLILDFVFGLPFALPIGILSGFLEIIPLVGPAIAAATAAVVALATPSLGFGGALWILLTYLIIRQLEDQVVMPLVVGRAVHLHPIITTFAVLAGGSIAGLLGTLLAVPIAAAANVVFDNVYPRVDSEGEPLHAEPMLGRAVNFARRRTAGRNQRVANIKGDDGK